MGPPDNRPVTSINMLAAFGKEASNNALERAGLFDSPDSTASADGSGKKTFSSPQGALEASTGIEKASARTVRSPTSGPLQLRMSWESPWKTYEKIYDVELGGLVAVAVRKADPVKLVHVRAFETQAATKTLYVYRQLQHQNIVTALEAFTTDDNLYIVVEHMPISLEQIVRSPAYPNERQLAAILSQIVTGVAYLTAEGFEHGSLTCSNILVNTDGDVKIANQECCHVKSEGRSRDITAVSSITMELMQKYVKEDGAVGVDNLHHWNSNSDALGFLSATTSAASAAELLTHPLLSRAHQKESLIGLVSLAQVCMRGRYKYTVKG